MTSNTKPAYSVHTYRGVSQGPGLERADQTGVRMSGRKIGTASRCAERAPTFSWLLLIYSSYKNMCTVDISLEAK